MHTLYDFINHTNGIEYLLAICLLAGYVLFWHLMKPRPFDEMVEAGREDFRKFQEIGLRGVLRSTGRVMAAPFIVMAYVIAVPFGFMAALGTAAINGTARLMGSSWSFGWRPAESYLTGEPGAKGQSKDKDTGAGAEDDKQEGES